MSALKLQKTGSVALLAFAFIVASAITGYAGFGEGPRPGETLSGPAIVGTVNISPTGETTFVGRCQGKDVMVGPIQGNPVTVVGDLIDVRGEVPAQYQSFCQSPQGKFSTIVNTVTKFTKFDDGSVRADLVILFIN